LYTKQAPKRLQWPRFDLGLFYLKSIFHLIYLICEPLCLHPRRSSSLAPHHDSRPSQSPSRQYSNKSRMPPKKAAVPEKKALLGRPSNNLKIGIVGLPNVGKSSFFNVLSNTGPSSSLCHPHRSPLTAPPDLGKAANFPYATINPEGAFHSPRSLARAHSVGRGPHHGPRCTLRLARRSVQTCLKSPSCIDVH
jgi:hypothetical protein